MTPARPAVLLEHYLRQLKLPAILREYAAVAAACTQDRSDYATYLLRLVEREVIEREHRAAERRIKAAGFPVLKTLDTFEFAEQPSINEAARGRPTWPACWPSPPAPWAAGCGSSP